MNPKKHTHKNGGSNGKANILDKIYAAPFENDGIPLGNGAANTSRIGEYDEDHMKHLGLAVVEDMNQRFVQVLDGDTQTDWYFQYLFIALDIFNHVIDCPDRHGIHRKKE